MNLQKRLSNLNIKDWAENRDARGPQLIYLFELHP